MISIKKAGRSSSACCNLLVSAFLVANIAQVGFAISFPFFGSYNPTPITTAKEQKELPIINADHGASSGLIAGGRARSSPWPATQGRDQFYRDQPSGFQQDSWRDRGYFIPESEIRTQVVPTKDVKNNVPTPSFPSRVRKVSRKSKQTPPKTDESTPPSPPSGSSSSNPNFMNFMPSPFQGQEGSLHNVDFNSLPIFYRGIGPEQEESFQSPESIFFPSNNFLSPFSHPYSHGFLPFTPRASNSHALPPEAVIQFLKSPEQQLSPLTRPQIKLPFPLRHDCSSGGGNGAKPLQFVVLPIVEPVAPLKPLIPKPSFLTPQYGQFPYIPPFNLFKKPPANSQLNNVDSSSTGGSGQFVPILNRPAPPLPFVFVQSLPLELIGQNMEMDIIHATSATEVKEAPPQRPRPQPVSTENIPSATKPLPLIVIEKVKTPGVLSPPIHSAAAPGVSPAAAVEITKSFQKGNSSSSVSTVSVVQPITQGSSPHHAEEIKKAIEKLVPVAAAVLDNVEKQQQKETGKASSGIAVISKEQKSKKESSDVKLDTRQNEQEIVPLRPPLRPDAQIINVAANVHKKPDSTSGEDVASTTLSEVEVMEAA